MTGQGIRQAELLVDYYWSKATILCRTLKVSPPTPDLVDCRLIWSTRAVGAGLVGRGRGTWKPCEYLQ